MHDYNVGDTIAYQPFGGGERIIVVDDKDSNIKNGEPGFGGRLVNPGPDDWADVWGYDFQITRVVKRKE